MQLQQSRKALAALLVQSPPPAVPVRVIDIPDAPYSLSHVSLDSIEDLMAELDVILNQISGEDP